MYGDGLRIHLLDEQVAENMLGRVLLTVLQPSLGIDLTVYAVPHPELICMYNMSYITIRRFNHFNEVSLVESAEVIRLSARCRVKGRPVKKDMFSFVDLLNADNLCVERQQRWVSVVQPLSQRLPRHYGVLG